MTLVVDKINHYNSIINKIIKFQLSLNTYRKRLIFLIIKAMQFQNIFVSYDEKIYSIKKLKKKKTELQAYITMVNGLDRKSYKRFENEGEFCK